MASWYHGDLSKGDADALLSGKPDGAFLVRERTGTQDYILSVNFRGNPTHHLLQKQDGSFCANRTSFGSAPTVSDLINILRKPAEKWPIVLNPPVSPRAPITAPPDVVPRAQPAPPPPSQTQPPQAANPIDVPVFVITPKKEAERALTSQGMQDGNFLVRARAKNDLSSFILSVIYKNQPTHHLMTVSPEGGVSVNKNSCGTAKTISQALTFLRASRPWWPVPLQAFIQPPRDKRLKVQDEQPAAADDEPLPVPPPRSVDVPTPAPGAPVAEAAAPPPVPDRASKHKPRLPIHTNMNKFDTEEVLMEESTEDGAYLLRERGENTYVITVRFKGRPTHHLVHCQDGVLTLNKQRIDGTFVDIHDVVAHLGEAHPYWPVPLQTPIFPQGMQASEAPAAPVSTPAAPVQQQQHQQQQYEEQQQQEQQRQQAQELQAAEELRQRQLQEQEAARQQQLQQQEQQRQQELQQQQEQQRQQAEAERKQREMQQQQQKQKEEEERQRRQREEGERKRLEMQNRVQVDTSKRIVLPVVPPEELRRQEESRKMRFAMLKVINRRRLPRDAPLVSRMFADVLQGNMPQSTRSACIANAKSIIAKWDAEASSASEQRYDDDLSTSHDAQRRAALWHRQRHRNWRPGHDPAREKHCLQLAMRSLVSARSPLDADGPDALVHMACFQRVAQLSSELLTLMGEHERAKDRDAVIREQEEANRQKLAEMFKPVKFSRRQLSAGKLVPQTESTSTQPPERQMGRTASTQQQQWRQQQQQQQPTPVPKQKASEPPSPPPTAAAVTSTAQEDEPVLPLSQRLRNLEAVANVKMTDTESQQPPPLARFGKAATSSSSIGAKQRQSPSSATSSTNASPTKTGGFSLSKTTTSPTQQQQQQQQRSAVSAAGAKSAHANAQQQQQQQQQASQDHQSQQSQQQQQRFKAPSFTKTNAKPDHPMIKLMRQQQKTSK
ncbi:hypothetical protein PTSG_01569 [Salpingoeca rosetta]|uniref:SH2 domain-containing protein n=1 Tax=Salpingoeca rosetta (strain ATCC 50818 / BSB-021) TaxID=946362 RepID=F2U0Q9_SALR5|nr:uncharacterized protein PTSG_01569 [Salpingoeca rosetta]EGD80987.1 hypothetical protein PTSG_01569 [Salpingoeca rosetta]|eukprot:XP_004997548.1 hypothetical protein PTSG_01569 [Salpingoeca rosetta]